MNEEYLLLPGDSPEPKILIRKNMIAHISSGTIDGRLVILVGINGGSLYIYQDNRPNAYNRLMTYIDKLMGIKDS